MQNVLAYCVGREALQWAVLRILAAVMKTLMEVSGDEKGALRSCCVVLCMPNGVTNRSSPQWFPSDDDAPSE